jgi:hypothetical protein
MSAASYAGEEVQERIGGNDVQLHDSSAVTTNKVGQYSANLKTRLCPTDTGKYYL